jgi:Flp pilus assembly protein TadB
VSYAFKLGGAAIAFLLIGVVLILIFDAVWFRVGFGAAAVIVAGGLIFWAWSVDRKEKAKRADLPPI